MFLKTLIQTAAKHFCAVLIILFLIVFDDVEARPSNILMIISDDLNTQIGPYMEIRQHTPNLDRLSNEGVRFTHTYCQYPLCGPSRASLMSGLYPESNGVVRNLYTEGSYQKQTPSLADHPSLAGFFREQGYFTARVSKIFHMGVPGGIERGDAGDDIPSAWDYAFNVLGPETQSPGKLELLSPGNLHYGSNFSRMVLKNEYAATQTDFIATSQAVAILESRAGHVAENATNKQKQKPEAPFFLAVGLVRPHVPLIAPENCFEPYPVEETKIPEVIVKDNVPDAALKRQNPKIWKMNETQKKQTISAYMASVRFMDQQVGRLLDALDRLNLRDNTIVIFISDHGYNLGEHDCWSKVSLWEGSVRVPMIISCPGSNKNRGTICKTITQLIDLYPTLTDLCGFSSKKPEILQGKSFAEYLIKNEPIKEEAFAYTISYGGKAATIRTKRWRYTRWGEHITENNEELYDHFADPEEHQNLADDSNKQKILLKMRQKFESVRKQAKNAQF